MSAESLSRRSWADIAFQGVNITNSLRPYFLSLTYTDNEEDEADDLQLRFQDREGIWRESWLEELVNAAAGGSFKIRAAIGQENWKGGGIDQRMDCGEFELDTVEQSGPPAIVILKATALPFSSSVRQTKKTKGWESYTLSGIANEISGSSGLSCMYESSINPAYDRVEQYQQSDIAFLSRLCKGAGLSLKVTDRMLVIFDQGSYEKNAPVRTIHRSKEYINFRLASRTADDQYTSCRVSYTDPLTGQCIDGVARVDDYSETAKNNQQLEIKAKVSSAGEARALAEKHLRLHNKFSKTARLTLPGDPVLLAGNTVRLSGWGAFDGEYLIRTAAHKVDAGGYTTTVELRRTIGGY